MEQNQLIEQPIGEFAELYNFRDPDTAIFKTDVGLTEDVVRKISELKGEPEWMLEFRLKALAHFFERPMPGWGPDLFGLDLSNLVYYVRPSERSERSWDDVPDTIKNTFDRLGIPEAEQKFLAGVGAQYESEMVYHSILAFLEEQGVIFLSIEDGLRQHPDLFRKFFGTIVPYRDNKFAALNSAVWSGGSFVYVPKGVKVDLPLQAYFRLNSPNIGQFERTLIIADEGAQVHYVEGCTAPQYSESSFHSGVIEIYVAPNARVRYSTIQNWSTNVYNLVTQRAKVMAHGTMEWVDANMGGKVTMKYPSCYLMGDGAHGEALLRSGFDDRQSRDRIRRGKTERRGRRENAPAPRRSGERRRGSYRRLALHGRAGLRLRRNADGDLPDEIIAPDAADPAHDRRMRPRRKRRRGAPRSRNWGGHAV